MARLSQGILGGISGQIGNLVGSSWKGISVIKTKALSVANPRTAGQIEQRDRMTAIVGFAQLFLASMIKPLNDRFASGMSGFNLFVSRNIAAFATGTLLDGSALYFSLGKMAGVAISSVVADVSLNTVVVNFPTTLVDSFAQASDKVYIAAYNPNSKTGSVSSGIVLRSAGTATLTLPQNTIAGEYLDVWLAFLRSDGTVCSYSTYYQQLVIA